MEVQQIRKQLEEMIRENQDRPVSMQQIRQKLQLNDPAQLQALEEAIRQLTEEYIAAISQKGNLISARMAGYEEGTITVNRKGFGFLDLESGELPHHISILIVAMSHQNIFQLVIIADFEILKSFYKLTVRLGFHKCLYIPWLNRKIGKRRGQNLALCVNNTEFCSGYFF